MRRSEWTCIAGPDHHTCEPITSRSSQDNIVVRKILLLAIKGLPSLPVLTGKLWVRYKGTVIRVALEDVRLATAEEEVGSRYILDAMSLDNDGHLAMKMRRRRKEIMKRQVGQAARA